MARCTARLALAALVVSAASSAGCGQAAEVQPVAPNVDSRVADLEKQLRDIRDKSQAAGLAAGVSGNEAADLRRTVSELQEQVRELQERLSVATTPHAAAGAGEGGAADGAPVTPLPLPSTFEPSPDGTFNESQVAYFRKLMDEVDRRKGEEAQAERVKRELTRAGVTLTADQEAAVLKLQQNYASKMRDVFRGGMGTTDADRQAALQQRDAIRAQYETDLRAVVPAGDADKIVEAMRRGWPGFFPRRNDGRRNPAGAGD